MFHVTVPTAMRDWSNPEGVYKRRDCKLFFKENSERTLGSCVVFLSFPMCISFELRIGLGHVQANVETPLDFDEVVVSPIVIFQNIINVPEDRPSNVEL